MRSYKASDGERLDLIVFDHYGSIEPLSQVLKHNPHLSKEKIILKAGETVKLPKLDQTKKENFSSTGKEEDSPLW